MFDFIYPHNSYLFSGIPQISVADDKRHAPLKKVFYANGPVDQNDIVNSMYE